MSFWKSLKNSVYNPAFYREVAKQRFSESFAFFVKYILVLSGVSSLVMLSFFAVFLYGGGLNILTDGVKSQYPEELSVTVANGTVSTNQVQPYGIPMPFGESVEEYDYSVVFDTEYPVTFESLKEFKAVVLVGEKSVGFRKGTGELRIFDIPNDANFTIDRNLVSHIVDIVSGYVKKYGFIVAIVMLPIMMFCGLFVGVMIYLVFASLLIWLVSYFKKIPYTYGQSYCIGMHLIVLPQAMATLFSWVTMFIPFFRTIVLTVLAVANLEREKPEPEKVESTTAENMVGQKITEK